MSSTVKEEQSPIKKGKEKEKKSSPTKPAQRGRAKTKPTAIKSNDGDKNEATEIINNSTTLAAKEESSLSPSPKLKNPVLAAVAGNSNNGNESGTESGTETGTDSGAESHKEESDSENKAAKKGAKKGATATKGKRSSSKARSASPSSNGGGKSKKKKKKKNAAKLKELERLAEEERKRQEELLAKQLEQERIEAEERERIRKEELERRRIDEAERRGVESKHIDEWNNAREKSKRQEFENSRNTEEWADFVRCNPLPRPQDQSSINTYLHIWRESETTDVTQVLNKCQEAEIVINRIIETKAEALDNSNFHQFRATHLKEDVLIDDENYYDGDNLNDNNNGEDDRGDKDADEDAEDVDEDDDDEDDTDGSLVTNRDIQSFDENIKILRELIQTKIDGLTAHILQFADELATAKNELQISYETKDENIKYSLWVNLAKNPRVKHIEYPNLHFFMELPKSLALASIAVRITQHSHNYLERMKFSKDQVIGGIFTAELLTLPPPPKKVKGWVLRPMTNLSYSVTRLPYPLTLALSEATPVAGSSQWPPLKLTFAISKSVIVPEIPVLAWWDTDKKEWKRDGITDVYFDNESRLFTFSTIHLSSIALIQERFKEFPYKYWSYQPSNQSRSKATVVIETQTQSIEFEIEDGKCRLIRPLRDELKVLNEKFWQISTLLEKLRDCGINVMPTDEWDEYLPTIKIKKNEKLEDFVYGNLALACPGFAITSSKWNSSIGMDKITMRIKEVSAIAAVGVENGNLDVPPSDKGWQTLLFEADNAAILRISDSDHVFSDSMPDGFVGHASLMATISEGIEKNLYESSLMSKCKSERTVHTNAVMRLLRLTGVLSFDLEQYIRRQSTNSSPGLDNSVHISENHTSDSTTNNNMIKSNSIATIGGRSVTGNANNNL